MIDKAINGRTYRLRDGLRASYLLRIAKASDEEAGFVLLHEMLLDQSGQKYPSIDAAAETIHVADFAELMDEVKTATGMDWDALTRRANATPDPLAT